MCADPLTLVGEQKRAESFDKFISDCVKRDPDADRISTTDAHRRYAAWCRTHDERPANQQKLTNKLKNEDVGYKQSIWIDGRVTRGYDALGFSDEVPALEGTPNRSEGENHRRDDDLTGY